MFHITRIKLTAWYLLIIMTISVSFSLVIYRMITVEFERSLRIQRYRIEKPFFSLPFEQSPRIIIDPDLINDAKERVAVVLFGANMIIFIISSAAGYYLAGRTLSPIGVMIEEQKRFIADASHELRTPLTSMRTEIEVTLRDKKMSLKSAKDLLSSNLEEVVKMQSLSDYLLKLNHYQAQGFKINFKKIKINEIISKAVNNLSKNAEKNSIRITNDVDDMEIAGNEISLTELFTILIDNAVKYNKTDGLVKIYSKKAGGQIKISIEDTGIGIKAGDIPYIFNRFYRADLSRTKNKVEGYGLGLSIAQKIVNIHNGRIYAESKPGEGSTFTVILPVNS